MMSVPSSIVNFKTASMDTQFDPIRKNPANVPNIFYRSSIFEKPQKNVQAHLQP